MKPLSPWFIVAFIAIAPLGSALLGYWLGGAR